MLLANYVATSAVVMPSLGRSLSGGAQNITVNIVPPGTLFGDRLNQVDLRFGKVLKIDRTRTSVNLDLFNATNRVNPTTYVGVITSPLFGQANTARPARSAQLSFRYRF